MALFVCYSGICSDVLAPRRFFLLGRLQTTILTLFSLQFAKSLEVKPTETHRKFSKPTETHGEILIPAGTHYPRVPAGTFSRPRPASTRGYPLPGSSFGVCTVKTDMTGAI